MGRASRRGPSSGHGVGARSRFRFTLAVAWAGSQRRLNFAQILAKVVVRMPTLEPRSYPFRLFM